MANTLLPTELNCTHLLPTLIVPLTSSSVQLGCIMPANTLMHYMINEKITDTVALLGTSIHTHCVLP